MVIALRTQFIQMITGDQALDLPSLANLCRIWYPLLPPSGFACFLVSCTVIPPGMLFPLNFFSVTVPVSMLVCGFCFQSCHGYLLAAYCFWHPSICDEVQSMGNEIRYNNCSLPYCQVYYHNGILWKLYQVTSGILHTTRKCCITILYHAIQNMLI